MENLASTAHDALVPQLESLPAIASVRLRGMRDQELRIRPDPARLSAAKISNERIEQAITSATSSRSMGTVMDIGGTQGVSLRGSANLDSGWSELPGWSARGRLALRALYQFCRHTKLNR